jgi:hypothetical protein
MLSPPAAKQEPGADQRRTAIPTPVAATSHRSARARHRVHRHNIIPRLRWGTLMRHVLLPGTPATGTRCMVHAPTAARLIASAGRPLRLLSRLLCTVTRTVDLATVAAAADQHLGPAAHAHEQPRCRRLRLGQCRTWTRAATSGILPRHTCSTRCGARRRYETWQLRSAPCPSIRQVVTAPSVRANPRHRPKFDRTTRAACGYVDNASALPTYPQAQQQQTASNQCSQNGRHDPRSASPPAERRIRPP